MDRFAEPHVVGETSPEPELLQEVEPAHADLLIRTKDAFEIFARVYLRKPLWAAQAFQHFRQPGAGAHLRPIGIFRGNIFGSDVRAGKQAHGLAESQTVVFRGLLHVAEAFDQTFQVFAVELDPTSAHKCKAFRFL